MQAQSSSPRITTIIPTYRRPKLLRRAIQSALNQSYKELQVCVFDNASGDETETIVMELARQDPRVTYFCHEQNIGAQANFIYAMARVNTPYFSFLSDDDVLLPGFYASALRGFEQYPDAIFSAGLVIHITEAGEVRNVAGASWPRYGYFAPPDGFFQMVGGNHPVMPGMLFRREVLDAFGLFDPDMLAADVDLELRLAARFPIVMAAEPYALFLYHDSSASVRSQIVILANDWPKVVQNIQQDTRIPAEVRAPAARAVDEYLRHEALHAGVRFVREGHPAEARKTAHILRERYQARRAAWMLSTAAGLSARSRLLRGAFALAYTAQHRRWEDKVKQFQKQYGAYAEYLNVT